MPESVFQFKFESDKALNSLRQLETATKRTEGQMSRLDGGAQKIKGSLNSLLGPLKGIAAGFASAFAIKSIIATADAMTLLRGRLELASGSTAKAEAALAGLTRIANENATSIESAATLYTRMANTIGQAGASQQQMLGITESLSAALRLQGATTAESSSVMLQFSQAMGSGILRGEEFNAIFESAPGVLQAVAKEMNVTIGALRGMAAEGKLTADIVGNALLNSLDEFREAAAKLPPTVGGALQTLSNSWSLLVDTLNTTTGVTEGIAGAIKALAGTIATFNQFIKDTPAFVDALKVAFQALGTVILAVVIGHLTRAAVVIGTNLVAALGSATGALGLFRGAMAVLGGPAGIVALVALSVFQLTDGFASQAQQTAAASMAAQQHGQALANMIPLVDAAKKSSDGLTNSLLKQAQASLLVAKNAVVEQQASIALAKDQIEYEKALQDGTASLLEFGDAGTQVNETILKQQAVISDAEATIFELSVNIDAMEAALQDAEVSMGDLTGSTQTAIPPLKLLGTTSDEASKGIKKVKESVENLPLSLSKLESSIRQLAEPYRKLAAEEKAAFDQMTKDAEAFTQEVNDISNRIGGTLADIFIGFLDGSADAFETVKTLFKRMLAEMLALAIANPIKLLIGTVLSGGGLGTAAAQGIGGIGGGIGGIGGAGGGGGGLFNIASAGNSLLGGGLTSSFLIGGANVLAGLGATGLATGLATSGSIIGASGLVGGIGASAAAAGGYLAAGSFTAALGVVAPYLAAIVAIASAFGLFGSSEPKSKGKIFGNLTPEGFETSDIVDQHFVLKPLQESLKGVTDTTTAVLDVIGGANIGQFIGVKQTEGNGLSGLVGPPGGGFSFASKADPEDAEAVENLFAQLTLAAITAADLSEVSAPLAAFLGNMTEEAIKQLDASGVESILNWLVSVGEAADTANETFEGISLLIGQFEGAPDEMMSYADALIGIGVAMSTSPLDDYKEAVIAANQTITGALRQSFGEAIRLAEAYDGSTASTIALAQAVTNYKQLAIQAAAAIDQALSFVTSSIEAQIQDIEFSLLTQEQQYDVLTAQAETLFAGLAQLSDPTEIAQTVQQIQQLVSQAFNLIPEELQAQLAPGFIDFLQEVQNTASAQLETLQEGVSDQFEELGELIDFSLLEAASQQISESAQLQSQAAQNMQEASARMLSAAAQQSAAAGQLGAAIASIPGRIVVQSNLIVPEIGGR